MEYLLNVVIFFPLFAGLVALLLDARVVKFFGVCATLVEFVLICLLWSEFDANSQALQYEYVLPLIASFGINYHVGIDGISLVLLLLTASIVLLSMLFLQPTHLRDIPYSTPQCHSLRESTLHATSWRDISASHFIAALLCIESILMGVFSAQNAMLFYIYWELSLLPILYLMGIWGGSERIKAAWQFFLYTFFASLIMLLGMLYYAFLFFLHARRFSFELEDWLSLPLPPAYQLWLFLAFFLAIAVKIPIIPFHAWLSQAYSNAPTIGSILLSALLLKMGTYALVRFVLPLFPDISVDLSMWIMLLALASIIYGAMLAYAQRDMKQVVAYSSLSHMGVVVMGVFSFTLMGISGAVFMMFAHGIVVAALFMLMFAVSQRIGSRDIQEAQGLARATPLLCALCGIVVMANVGLPLTIGFVGEFLSLLGVFAAYPVLALLGGGTIILSAAYMPRLYKQIFFGKPIKAISLIDADVSMREKIVFSIFGACIIALGIYPKPLLKVIDPSVTPIIESMHTRAQKPHTQEVLHMLKSKQEHKERVIESSHTQENISANVSLDATKSRLDIISMPPAYFLQALHASNSFISNALIDYKALRYSFIHIESMRIGSYALLSSLDATRLHRFI